MYGATSRNSTMNVAIASALPTPILTRQADEVVEVYARNGINLAHREEIGDWVTLTLRKSAQ